MKHLQQHETIRRQQRMRASTTSIDDDAASVGESTMRTKRENHKQSTCHAVGIFRDTGSLASQRDEDHGLNLCSHLSHRSHYLSLPLLFHTLLSRIYLPSFRPSVHPSPSKVGVGGWWWRRRARGRREASRVFVNTTARLHWQAGALDDQQLLVIEGTKTPLKAGTQLREEESEKGR